MEKSNKSGIRWKGQSVEWGELQLEALIIINNDPVILRRCPEVEWVAAEAFKKTSKSQDVVGEIR